MVVKHEQILETEEDYIKKWGKGLKNSSFWGGGGGVGLAPPCTPLGMIEMHNIYYIPPQKSLPNIMISDLEVVQ